MSHPWFEDWFNSPYYHLLYFNRDEKEAAKFVDQLLDHLRPAPGSKMLDVACGRGRHSIYLAQMGFDVTGFDLSPNSIIIAKQHEHEHLHFYQHDMRLPFWIHYYDFAFNFFTSFGYFKTRRDNDNAVRTIAQSLRYKGVVVIDYLNAHYAESHFQHKVTKEIDGVIFYITKWMDETHFFKKIEIEDERLEAPLIFTEQVAKFTLGDFTEMLAYNGIQIQEVYGDYNFGRYDILNSPRMIMIGRKGA